MQLLNRLWPCEDLIFDSGLIQLKLKNNAVIRCAKTCPLAGGCQYDNISISVKPLQVST